MDPESNPERPPIRLARSTWLFLMAIIWSCVAALPIAFFAGGPPGAADTLRIVLYCLGTSSFLWMPLVFVGYCLGKRRISADDTWRFLGITILGIALSSGFTLWFVGHSWLD
jgi:hypothetical protein